MGVAAWRVTLTRSGRCFTPSGLSECSPPKRLRSGGPATQITINLKDAQYPADRPVTIMVSIGGRPIQLGHPVRVNGKWIGTTVITLRNISPKTIVQAGVGMVFPECGDGSHDNPYEAVWSTLGLVPRVVYTDRNGHYHPPPAFVTQPAALRVPPGGTVRLAFSMDGDAVQTKMARKCPGVSQANLTFTTIYFADDSRWSVGVYYLAPGAVPGVWTRVSKKEFFRQTTVRP
ncbi:MAG TPA: hypothetical protein VGF88_22200 [Acidobacteriaceae bacterium]|jgi:hypothetical protein